MAPLRGNKRKKRVEKNDEEKSLVPGSSHDGFAEWWDVFSKKVAESPSTSRELDTFKSFFGVSKTTFSYICVLVKDHMMSKSNFTFTNGKHIPLQDQVALALRRLGSGHSLVSIGEMFKTYHSTVSQVTWRFVVAMEENQPHYLKWPSTEAQISDIKSKFEKIRGLPNCCGVIDTTHISFVLTSSDKDADYWLDQNKKHSMILQAIINPDMRFLDIIVGWPGSMHESSVVQTSNFFRQCQAGQKLNGDKILVSKETELREYIIGDAAFPLLPWLMTPYQGKHLSEAKMDFNRRLTATHFVAERALMRFKETWRIFKSDMWRPDKHRLPRMILACCVLHNIIIEMEKDEDLEEFDTCIIEHDPGYVQEICEGVDKNGLVMRKKLTNYFSGKCS